MIIMGLLQCTWAKDPERVAALLAECPERRNERIAMLLFWGCLTGRRLRTAFGPLCDDIVWENATSVIAGEASGCPPGDPEHVAAAIARIDPNVLLVFGKVATDTYLNSEAVGHRCKVIYGPHPTNRRMHTQQRLEDMRRLLEEKMKE